MAETAAYLVDHVIPRVSVRKWVLSFAIPPRILFAAHPELLSPVLQIIHRVIATFLIKQAGLKRRAADTGAVTLIPRFGSAAILTMTLSAGFRFPVSPLRSCYPSYGAPTLTPVGLSPAERASLRWTHNGGFLGSEWRSRGVSEPG